MNIVSFRRLRVRTLSCAVAFAAAAALTVPAVAVAEPEPGTPDAGTDSAPAAPDAATPTDPAPSTVDPAAVDPEALSQSLLMGQIPYDTELAEALRALKQAGVLTIALDALTSILGSSGRLDPGLLIGALSSTAAQPSAAATTPAEATPAADPISGTDLLGRLQQITGAQVLTPAIAPFCTAPTADNPLGLINVPALAVPGPWPAVNGTSVDDLLAESPLGPLFQLLTPQDQQLIEVVGKDQTAYALLPPTGHTNPQFRVAWFNTTSLDGGIAELQTPSEALAGSTLDPLFALVEQTGGVRLARVDTGQGAVLSAVFGTTANGTQTCYFLPAVGVVNTPAGS